MVALTDFSLSLALQQPFSSLSQGLVILSPVCALVARPGVLQVATLLAQLPVLGVLPGHSKSAAIVFAGF